MRYWSIIPNRPLSFLIMFTCSFLTANSQVNTSSPYSRFGLGETQKQGFIKSLSMGSAGIALRTNNQINYLNPASYSATDTLSFLFDFGINTYYNTYKSNEDEATMQNINLHHIAISFPVTRWWKSAMGVVPLTSVGYSIKESRNIAGIGVVENLFDGNGGLNKFFIGNSVHLLNRFDIGFNLNYIFGFINYSRTMRLMSENSSMPSSISRMDIGSLAWQFGFQYTETIKDKYFFTLGAVLENGSKLKANGSFVNQLVFPGTSAVVVDSTVISSLFNIRNETASGNINYPSNLGLGLSFGIKNKLTITGDYYMQDWSNALIMGRSDSLVNSNSLHFGAEYIPSTSSMKGFLSRVNYRLGGYYSNSYISIRGEQIKDYGMTFGVGLPFRNTQTTYNIGCILGERGTLNNDLIKERYGIIHFGVTFHDIWFRKRKYE